MDCCVHTQNAPTGFPLPEKGEECTQTLSVTSHWLGVNRVTEGHKWTLRLSKYNHQTRQQVEVVTHYSLAV